MQQSTQGSVLVFIWVHVCMYMCASLGGGTIVSPGPACGGDTGMREGRGEVEVLVAREGTVGCDIDCTGCRRTGELKKKKG